MVDVDAVDYNVGHVLQRDAAVTGYVDVNASAVHGFIAVEDELMLELYRHVRRKYNPDFLNI